MKFFVIFGFLIAISLTSCSYPTQMVRIPNDRPAIAIQGAPEDAILYVDGLSMGIAHYFNGKSRTLLLEPGTHSIKIVSQGRTILLETLFLGDSGVKTLSVGGMGGKR